MLFEALNLWMICRVGYVSTTKLISSVYHIDAVMGAIYLDLGSNVQHLILGF